MIIGAWEGGDCTIVGSTEINIKRYRNKKIKH